MKLKEIYEVNNEEHYNLYFMWWGGLYAVTVTNVDFHYRVIFTCTYVNFTRQREFTHVLLG